MNTGREQKPFSVPEIAAGALAAVGLIAVIGVMMSQPQPPSPAAPASAAAAPPWDASVVVAPPATLRQLPKSGGMSRERQVAEPAAAAGVPPVPAPSRALAPPVSEPPAQKVPTSPPLPPPPPATAMQPVEPRSATALSGRLLDILRSEDPEDAPPRQSAQEPPRPTGAERNPLNRSDATSIQRRLHELGYYSGDEKGVWGAASRRALRDFKRMNGLQDDDKWDRHTEAQLLSGPGVHASRTFIGRWALDADECLQRDDGAQLVIDTRGAETAGGKCDFRSFKQDSANSWRIRAVCSASGKSWSADIGLKLNGPQLQWSSERGTETYMRCPNSERAPMSRAAAPACEILSCGRQCDLYGTVHSMRDTGPCPRPGASVWFHGWRPPWR